MKSDGFAKVELENLKVVQDYLKPKDLKLALKIVKKSLKGFGMSGLIKGKEVHFDDVYLHVKLEDDRIISTPIDWYKPLQNATLSQLKKYSLICLDTGIEWEELDYHLNIESMLFASQEKVA